MRNSFDWCDVPDPPRFVGTLYVELLPALALAGAACMGGVFVAAMATASHGNVIDDGAILRVLLYALIGGIVSAIVGFPAAIFVSLVDASFGRILSPISVGASCVGLSVIPIAILGIFQQAFSAYPDSDTFIYFYFVPITFVGCIAGIWGARARVAATPNGFGKSFRYSSRQLLALIFWVALIFALGFGSIEFLTGASIYLAIVFVTVFAYSKLISNRKR